MSKDEREKGPLAGDKGAPQGCALGAADSSACAIAGDPEMLASGWERRYVADERMARDALALYQEMGFEVRLEPVPSEGVPDQCAACAPLLQRFVMVYTRRKG